MQNVKHKHVHCLTMGWSRSRSPNFLNPGVGVGVPQKMRTPHPCLYVWCFAAKLNKFYPPPFEDTYHQDGALFGTHCILRTSCKTNLANRRVVMAEHSQQSAHRVSKVFDDVRFHTDNVTVWNDEVGRWKLLNDDAQLVILTLLTWNASNTQRYTS